MRDRDRSWTVLELLRWTTDYFKRAGIETARLDAELLLAHALETERLRLYIDYEKPVLTEERDRYRALVQPAPSHVQPWCTLPEMFFDLAPAATSRIGRASLRL